MSSWPSCVLIGMPITFAATIALLPLWSMIERRYGIESVGHSGPADWCFWAVFGVYLCLAGIISIGVRRRTGADPSTRSARSG
ncbi:MAG: hypothetical protein JF589_07655 [Gemmatimonadetes bacterium]|nr:hypothetical protein [Gemmatimonadota bacterium]